MDALRFIYTDRRTCCMTVSLLVLFCSLKCHNRNQTEVSWVWAPATVTKPWHRSNKKHFNSFKSSAANPHPPDDGEDSSWAKRSPFAYSVLLPQYLMWQPILRGHWLLWPPSGRKEYIFMWRWTAVLTNNIRKAMGTVTEVKPWRMKEIWTACLITFILPQSCVFTSN